MGTPEFVLELRRHIGNAPLWIPGCTAIVIRYIDDEPHILVVRRSDNGDWTPVTGIVDPGEEPADAAQREVLEEAGVHARARRLISTEVVGPVVYDNGDQATYLDVAFYMEWVSGEPWPADGENTEASFVPLSDLPPMNERFRRLIAHTLGGEQATFFRFQES